MDTYINMSETSERVNTVWKTYTSKPQPNYDTPLHQYLTHLHSTRHPLISASSSGILSTTYFVMTVPAAICNSLGFSHGGATATVFDVLTSVALSAVSKPGIFQYLGVTRTLNCTYLKPVMEGMRVVIGCDVVQVGRRLAVVRGWMREWDENAAEEQGPVRMKGELLATCEHGKVNTDPPVPSKRDRGGVEL